MQAMASLHFTEDTGSAECSNVLKTHYQEVAELRLKPKPQTTRCPAGSQGTLPVPETKG